MNACGRSIKELTLENEDFRRVLYTARNCVVLMALQPKEESGAEVHQLDQFCRVEAGAGLSLLAGVCTELSAGSVMVVPAGATHNIINTGRTALKLYTLYAAPRLRRGIEPQHALSHLSP